MPSVEEIRAYQRQQTDYFYFWRLGQGRKYDREARRDAIAKIDFPRQGKWPDFERPQPGGAEPEPMRKRRYRPRPIASVWSEAGPSSTKLAAGEAKQRLVRKMETAGFRFVKLLGWGGLGVAILFETIGKDDKGERMKVVVKMDLYQDTRCIWSEILMHLRTAGAKHVIQRLVLQGKPRKTETGILPWKAINVARRQNVGPEPPQEEKELFDDLVYLDKNKIAADMRQTAREGLDADNSVLFIEFMHRGRFSDYIGKAGLAQAPFPSPALWQIFDCLFRALVGLAYPDKFKSPNVHPRVENMPQVSEYIEGSVPHRAHGSAETIVHFDIDPLNVLVGEFDGSEHNIVPLVKISDLGLAQLFNRAVRMDIKKNWSYRKRGKTHIYTPEQWSEEWDYINATPYGARSQTAGNYHWWTNLYQVGLIMFSIITLCDPEYPPIIEQIPLTNPLTNETVEEWTTGGYLFSSRFERVDWELRHLVAMCLIYNPNRRPTMHMLNTVIKSHVRQKGGPQTRGELEAQEWAMAMFLGPPPPPVPDEDLQELDDVFETETEEEYDDQETDVEGKEEGGKRGKKSGAPLPEDAGDKMDVDEAQGGGKRKGVIFSRSPSLSVLPTPRISGGVFKVSDAAAPRKELFMVMGAAPAAPAGGAREEFKIKGAASLPARKMRLPSADLRRAPWRIDTAQRQLRFSTLSPLAQMAGQDPKAMGQMLAEPCARVTDEVERQLMKAMEGDISMREVSMGQATQRPPVKETEGRPLLRASAFRSKSLEQDPMAMGQFMPDPVFRIKAGGRISSDSPMGDPMAMGQFLPDPGFQFKGAVEMERDAEGDVEMGEAVAVPATRIKGGAKVVDMQLRSLPRPLSRVPRSTKRLVRFGAELKKGGPPAPGIGEPGREMVSPEEHPKGGRQPLGPGAPSKRRAEDDAEGQPPASKLRTDLERRGASTPAELPTVAMGRRAPGPAQGGAPRREIKPARKPRKTTKAELLVNKFAPGFMRDLFR